MRKRSWIIALFIVFGCCQELLAQCPELNGFIPPRYEPEKEEPAFRVDSLEGNALYSVIPTHDDMGRANDLCVALYSEKEGYLIASTRTGLKGEFSFQGQTPGRYRMIAVSKAMIELNIIVELKEKLEKELEKQQRLLLHMRLKSSQGRKSFASLISVKEYQEREKL